MQLNMEKYFFKRKYEATSDEQAGAKVAKLDIEFNPMDLPTDPGLRPSIMSYNTNIRDQVRRFYLQKGPCQPKNHEFPTKQFGKEMRRFNLSWFNECSDWLEYSTSKNAAFCLHCYLFKPCNGEQAGGDSFTITGFTNWKDKKRLQVHVGNSNSSHSEARRKSKALMNEKQHIEAIIIKKTTEARSDYRTRLIASIDCIRFLLRQGLAFRGHDESENSSNQGNFLELLRFHSKHNDDIKRVVGQNAPENIKLTSPDIQKDIVHAFAVETVNVIIKDVGDSLFSVLVDESRDVSMKEQMAVVLRYVNKKGQVVERFIGIEHVASTTAVSLKSAIDHLFSMHGLSISRLRGQGYDGASNMQGELNGLKALILKENPCAFYIHCFAHQLQLALVHVAKKHIQIASLFNVASSVVNTVGASAKRCDILQNKQTDLISQAIKNGDIATGRGLNQRTSLKRHGDTRWGSYYGTLVSVCTMFSSIVEILEMIVDDGTCSDQRCEASNLLVSILSFDFVLCLHLMKLILGVTHELSKALQRKDQDIVNAMSLVKVCKKRLQSMRENGWDHLFKEVSLFCQVHSIDVPDMDGIYKARGRPRRRVEEATNSHQYRVELFYSVIDMQLQELNDRFSEVNTELLLCIACLCPDDSFRAFDKEKLVRLAEFYPNDFSVVEVEFLKDQLDNYIVDMHLSEDFVEMKGIGALAQKMVETKKNDVHPLVYRLITLALILPVATATVERVFSAMNIVKNRLRNRIGDDWMTDSLVVYIEKEFSDCVTNEDIIQRFQKMKTRRHKL